MTKPHLYYIHDPMCSWCWGFRPVFEELRRRLPDGVSHSRLLGGLAPDTDQPMPEEMRQGLQATWRRIEQKLPRTRFNHDFWRLNQPRRATYPACRAVIAARSLQAESEEAMILAIQEAYYLQARNPSDDATLIALAAEIGLHSRSFEWTLHAPETRQTLVAEISRARSLGVDSYPTLILEQGESRWPLAVDYQKADPMLETLQLLLS